MGAGASAEEAAAGAARAAMGGEGVSIGGGMISFGMESGGGSMSPEEIARINAMLAMSPEEQAKKAAAAMKDCLELAATTGLERAAEPATWEEEANRIPCPFKGKFESLQRQIEKVPMVGKTLAKPVAAGVENVEKAFVDAASTIGKDPAVALAYKEAVAGVPQDEAVDLVKGAPGSFTEYLAAQTDDVLTDKVTATVAAVLETHSLTKVWGGATDAYNKAAAKVPGGLVKPIELDLPTYVVEQAMATLKQLVADKEVQLREDPGDDAPETVKEIFGGGLRTAMMQGSEPLVLVKPDDPRQIQFVDFPRSTDEVGATPEKLVTGKGLEVVITAKQPVVQNKAWKVLTLGFGQAAEIADEKDLRMHAPKFHRRGRFLVADVFGEEYPLKVDNGRYFDQNAVKLVRHARDDSKTFYEGGALDFNFSKETKLVGPDRCKQWTSDTYNFVLGLKKNTLAADLAKFQRQAL